MPLILIADDKKENRFVLKNFFKLFGQNSKIKIIEASSGKEAYEMIIENKPDLVLLDIKMETATAGFQVVEAMRRNEETKNIEAWAITAQALQSHDIEDSDREKCISVGFNDYLAKPFDPVDLMVKASVFLSLEIPENVQKKIGLI